MPMTTHSRDLARTAYRVRRGVRAADPHATPHAVRGRRRVLASLVVALTASAAAACNDLLEVENPNNVNAEALTNPASAANQVNGVLAATTRAANQLVGHLVTASDEMTWTGSLDGMDRINRGFV